MKVVLVYSFFEFFFLIKRWEGDWVPSCSSFLLSCLVQRCGPLEMGPSSSPFSLLLVLFAVGSFARYVVAQETGTGGVKGISKIPRTAPVFNKTPYFGGWVTSEGANANASVVGTTMRTWNGQVR